MPEETVAGQSSFIFKDWAPLLLKATKNYNHPNSHSATHLIRIAGVFKFARN
jgi:hypothetical protein